MKQQIRLKGISLILVPGMVLLSNCTAPQPQTTVARWKIEDGVVPDSATAIAIARIVWSNLYGTNASNKKNFTATLKEGKIWSVNGNSYPELGYLYAEIDKKTGAVLMVNRYK